MTDADWDSGFAKSVALALDGDAITETDARGSGLHPRPYTVIRSLAERRQPAPAPKRTA